MKYFFKSNFDFKYYIVDCIYDFRVKTIDHSVYYSYIIAVISKLQYEKCNKFFIEKNFFVKKLFKKLLFSYLPFENNYYIMQFKFSSMSFNNENYIINLSGNFIE